MKLKLVVASMSVLGLVSCPVFAATNAKHKHHHKMKHQTVATRDYKDMGSLPPAKDAIVCSISQASMIMDGMEQNGNRSIPNPCNPGWFNRIQVSGGLNVDLGKFGNRNTDYMGENYQRFSLNDAYLNLAADVNDWTKAFVSISYNTASTFDPLSSFLAVNDHISEYSSAYSNNVTGGASNAVQLEQAYATFGNFDMSPFFIQVGKQFQDFSRYEIHPITRSLTQVMSETLATSAKVGFIAPMGFNGAIYAFDDPIAKIGQTQKTTNYGVSLGFDQPSDQFGWDIGAGYLYNLIGVNDVAYRVNQLSAFETVYGLSTGTGYRTRVAATALYGDINSGPFTVGVRYTTALQRFNSLDLPKNTSFNNGAKPWAAGITAGYGFDAWGKNQNIYLGYQASNQAGALSLPKGRWLAGYGIDVFGRNTNIGIEWDHDQAYSQSQLGSNNNTNLVSVRTAVKFG